MSSFRVFIRCIFFLAVLNYPCMLMPCLAWRVLRSRNTGAILNIQGTNGEDTYDCNH